MTNAYTAIARWARLAWTFPVLRPYLEMADLGAETPPEELDARNLARFDEACLRGGDAAQCAAAFVLELWDDNGHAWAVGRFRIRRAAETWDREQQAAFVAWAATPETF